MDAIEKAHIQSVEDLASTLQQFGISEVPRAQHVTTYPELNPVDIYRSHITELLAPIAGVDPKIVYPAIQWTNTLEMGDLALPVAALRIKGKKPDQLAAELGEKFPESTLVQKPVVDKGFLKFFYQPQPLTKLIIPSILKNKDAYGFNRNLGFKDPQDPSKGRKKLVIDFSSPNIAKPFHAGHLRSTIIGGFLANLYEGAGWDVVRLNYLGDWGKQYGVLAIGFEKFGDEKKLVENPIGHLYDIYVQVSKIQKAEEDEVKALEEEVKQLQAKNEPIADIEGKIDQIKTHGIDQQARNYFKRMVDGEKDAIAIWERFRDLSIERYKATYERLNISFDEYWGESKVKDESMEAAAKIMMEKGVSEESQGAVVVDFAKHGAKKLGKAIVKKKDGTSLYLTRDIGGAFERMEKYHPDKLIYVVASQQDLHFQQLFKIEELIGRKDIADISIHINFGMVQGMSTRKGTAKFLDDILRDVGDFMHDVMRKNEDKYKQVEDPDRTSDILGISAVMIQDMTGKRINNYTFDLAKMTAFEGDTGPYLQYAHARLSSILRKADIPLNQLLSADLSLLSESHAINLVRALAQWPDVFLQTLKTQEPITVLTYLFKMTHALSSSYDHLQIVRSEGELKKARLALYVAARQVLANGMRLLGLSPLERM